MTAIKELKVKEEVKKVRNFMILTKQKKKSLHDFVGVVGQKFMIGSGTEFFWQGTHLQFKLPEKKILTVLQNVNCQ